MSAQTLPQDSSCGIGGRLSDVDVLLSNVTYRPLVPSDQKKLKRMHDELLPVDYNQDFFDRACSQSRGILGYAAVLPADEELVGFITVCNLAAHEIATADRRLLGLSGDENDDVRVMYILTLGVCKSHRRAGLAQSLLRLVEAQAIEKGCQYIYLHVISYNEGARSFYSSCKFELVEEIPDFYHIQTGRAAHPDVDSYGDKFLYQFTIVHSPAGRWADTQSSGTMYLVITQTSAGYDGSLQAQMYLGKTISSNEESSSSFSPDMVVGMVLG